MAGCPAERVRGKEGIEVNKYEEMMFEQAAYINNLTWDDIKDTLQDGKIPDRFLTCAFCEAQDDTEDWVTSNRGFSPNCDYCPYVNYLLRTGIRKTMKSARRNCSARGKLIWRRAKRGTYGGRV